MTFPELQIQFDLNPDNRVNILKNADTCRWTDDGYLFVDSEDGHCYLFNDNGQKDDISKVKWIEYSAFYNCIALRKIEIPNLVKDIGSYVFYNCKFLTTIKIPDSVESIEKCAFYYCTSLACINIPNSVKIIGDYAFHTCTSLANIKIPNTVKDLGNLAFYSCTSLKEVVFEGKTMDEVKAMDWYPWGIKDESVIKVKS